ncbi:unnamed protein product [Cylindrotheca closterium]|uniref:subtilisin n=1 Tax=Cylindrotheca closterium TaxID=2856 RepID=A0AAD2FV75_9STRA|nr:unnamed protein product [Cylindrotheca closterium]
MVLRKILLLRVLLILSLVSPLIQAAEEESEQREDDDYVRVLVGFHDRDQEKEYVRRQRMRPRTGKPQSKINYEFKQTEALAMQVTRAELEEMRRDSKQFSYVEEDILVPVAAAAGSSNSANATNTWDERMQRQLLEFKSYGIELTQAHRTINPDPNWDQECGVYLCVIDSGVFIDNLDIPYSRGDGYVDGKTFGSAEGQEWFNPKGTDHGTQVAGVMIAQGGNNRGISGVIPMGPKRSNVCLRVAKVVSDGEGVSSVSALLQASEWCAEEAGDKPVVINLSFGVEIEMSTEKAIYQRLYDQGALIVAAAGNRGGTDYMYPAAHDSVISVASINARSEHSRFSQRNDKVEIAAPGEQIQTLKAESNEIMVSQGTSLASPFVAGLAARIWTAVPRCSNKEVRQALRDTARRLGDGVPNRNFGYGLIRARDAHDMLVASGCNPEPPTKAPTQPPTPAPTIDWGANTFLREDERINQDNRIVRNPDNKDIYLQQQSDGNLVLFDQNNQIYWSSGIVHIPSNKRYWSVLQGDGNLVTYSEINNDRPKVEWASNSQSPIDNYNLVLTPNRDGMMIARRSDGQIIWSSRSSDVRTSQMQTPERQSTVSWISWIFGEW